MSSTLSERIQKHQENKQKQSSNKVAFFKLRDEIAEALESGFTITSIWETLHDEGKITATYNTFRLSVTKYIKSSDTIGNTKKNAPTPPKDFTYDPKANIDHLI